MKLPARPRRSSRATAVFSSVQLKSVSAVRSSGHPFSATALNLFAPESHHPGDCNISGDIRFSISTASMMDTAQSVPVSVPRGFRSPMVTILSLLSRGARIARLFQWKSWKRSLYTRGPVAHLPGISPRPTDGVAYVIMQGGGHPRAPFKEPTETGREQMKKSGARAPTGARNRDGPRLENWHVFSGPFGTGR